MNKIFTTIILFTLSSLTISQQVLANSPATEDNMAAPPSSVEMIMQRSTSQTGDVVTLPAKEMQPGETIQIKVLDQPRRGMSMDQVRNKFGEPLTVADNVGEPPITSWTYSDRVVFFENTTVIHVVSK